MYKSLTYLVSCFLRLTFTFYDIFNIFMYNTVLYLYNLYNKQTSGIKYKKNIKNHILKFSAFIF